MRGQGLAAGALAGIAGMVLAALAVWLTVVYTGSYNVAATEPHSDIARWTLSTTMHTSVARRAGAVEPPATVDADRIAAGAEAYAGACAHCHGAPGQERAPWAANMRPQPPHLTEAASEWAPEEVFWIVQNGIRMSGMPAFGPEHDEAALWGITAFVKQLPGMSPADYENATGGGHAAGG